jgi:hypothetical protein
MGFNIVRRGAWRLQRLALRLAAFALLLLPSYALLAYVLLPAAWRHPAARMLQPPAERVTFTQEGIPSDPLNVALVGRRQDLIRAIRAAWWAVADPICFRSGLRDAHSVLFGRPYETAPMSTHYLWNRPQDLAFEKTVGGSPTAAPRPVLACRRIGGPRRDPVARRRDVRLERRRESPDGRGHVPHRPGRGRRTGAPFFGSGANGSSRRPAANRKLPRLRQRPERRRRPVPDGRSDPRRDASPLEGNRESGIGNRESGIGNRESDGNTSNVPFVLSQFPIS